MPLVKKVGKPLAIASAVVLTSMGTVATAQSFLPGSGGLGNVLGGGGGGIYSSGGLGDILSGGGVGSIFGDVLGGIGNDDFSGILESVLGGNVLGSKPCGNPAILNIAPDYDCTPGSVGSTSGGGIAELAQQILTGGSEGGAGSIFGTIFDVVGNELGLPPEITGIFTGKSNLGNVFEAIVDEALGAVGLKTEMGAVGSNNGLVGAAGIPDYDNIMAALTVQLNGDGLTESSGLFTPNVIGSLINPTLTMGALTDVTTGRVISEEGQQVAIAREAAGKTVTETSGNMGITADMASQAQMAVAETVTATAEEQTSTQDTLKVVLGGMNLLQAQATQFDSLAAQQRALTNQMQTINLGVLQEVNAGVATNSRAIQLSNELAVKASQEEKARNASLRHEFGIGVRTMGAMR
ncbi:MAG: hypothetical protein AAF810_08755 [Cyanobacteria bacterium P01_D01_bin.36]